MQFFETAYFSNHLTDKLSDVWHTDRTEDWLVWHVVTGPILVSASWWLLLSPHDKSCEEAIRTVWHMATRMLLTPLHDWFINHVNQFVNTLANICVLVIFSPGKYALFLICHYLVLGQDMDKRAVRMCVRQVWLLCDTLLLCHSDAVWHSYMIDTSIM